MSLRDEISTPYAIALQRIVRVKGCQKPLKDMLAMHQKLGLGIVCTFLIN